MTDALDLPSAGPDPIPWDTALAAVLGYARPPSAALPRPQLPDGSLGADPGLRLRALRPPGRVRTSRSASPTSSPPKVCTVGSIRPPGRRWRAFWTTSARSPTPSSPAPPADPCSRLEDDEFFVLAEPGTVGALLRTIGQRAQETPGVSAKHVSAALHHRRPDLFPLLVRTTRWQLLPHVREGDSGVEAVIHRDSSRTRRCSRSAAGARRQRHLPHRPPAARRPSVALRQPPADPRRRAGSGHARRRCRPLATARRVSRAATPQGRRRRS